MEKDNNKAKRNASARKDFFTNGVLLSKHLKNNKQPEPLQSAAALVALLSRWDLGLSVPDPKSFRADYFRTNTILLSLPKAI